MVIAIDPGRNIGYALASEGVVVECRTVRDKALLPRAALAIIEMPRVYPSAAKWRGDPQDIVRLAYLAGEIAALYPCHTLVPPAKIPKRVRASRALAALRPGDVALERASNHALDALYILLVEALGRSPRAI